jgi:FkbM family methyltransferase
LEGKVVSVEPNPAALACLDLNIERNALTNVTSVHAAVGREGEPMRLDYYPGWEVLSSNADLAPPWFNSASYAARFWRQTLGALFKHPRRQRASRQVTAPRMSLGRIMDEHGLGVVNFLKMDCEGSEFEVMRNIRPEHWSRIERVAIEYHEYGKEQRHTELVSILQAHGFEVEVRHSLIEKLHRLFNSGLGAIWARKPRFA